MDYLATYRISSPSSRVSRRRSCWSLETSEASVRHPGTAGAIGGSYPAAYREFVACGPCVARQRIRGYHPSRVH